MPPSSSARTGVDKRQAASALQPQHQRLRRGAACEALVAEFLQSRGLQLLERNVRRRVGELDLVMYDAGTTTVVFVEVRYRRQTIYGGALASVTRAKQRRLQSSARAWLAARRRLHEPARIDVIGVAPAQAQTGLEGLTPAVVDELESVARREGRGLIRVVYQDVTLSWLISALED